jgi:hypothetical protein
MAPASLSAGLPRFGHKVMKSGHIFVTFCDDQDFTAGVAAAEEE